MKCESGRDSYQDQVQFQLCAMYVVHCTFRHINICMYLRDMDLQSVLQNSKDCSKPSTLYPGIKGKAESERNIFAKLKFADICEVSGSGLWLHNSAGQGGMRMQTSQSSNRENCNLELREN